MLIASCYEDYSKSGTAPPGDTEETKEGDVEVENLDDSNEV
jgi:hypothetical protein